MSAGPRRSLVPPVDKKLAASRHGVAGAANRIGSIKIRDRICEGIGGDRPGLPERPPRSPRHLIRFSQYRMLLPHPAAQIAQGIEWQRTADRAGYGAQ